MERRPAGAQVLKDRVQRLRRVVQRLAAGISSAAITSVYFATSNPTDTVTNSLIIVLVTSLACLATVRLLPRNAPPEALLQGA